MHRRLLSAAASGALLLGLAGCGDSGDGPVTTPPPDLGIEAPSDGGGGGADPSDGGGERDEPTADAPDIPPPDPADFAGMDENTPEGAEQAFKYYIAVSMWAHQTGDDSLLSDLRSSGCTGCDDFMETYEELRKHGELWSEFSLSDVTLESYESDSFDMEVNYDFTTTSHIRPKNDFSGTTDVGELEYLTASGMNWIDGHWTVMALNAEWGDDVF